MRCASLEQQGRIVPANNRYRAGEASIRSSEEQDRSRHHSAHRGGPLVSVELSTALGRGCIRVRVGRPSVVWLCGLYGWSGQSSTRLGGVRALKKTPEAPYTTK